MELIDLVMRVAERFKPQLILIEGYAFKSERSTSQAEFGGCLRWELTTLGADILEVAPVNLKQFATGVGKGDKTRLIAAVAHRWGVEFATDDEYDAYALARMAACIAELEPTTTEAQRKAIATVLGGRRLKRDTA
jgi:Holliday junction resolvasome RuvABC endonuclease subunit